MKYLIIGDIHLDNKVGNKNTFYFINKIKDILISYSNKVNRTVILGDLFKNVHPDNPMRKELSVFLSKLKNVYIILGNHDIDINGHVLLDLQPIVKNIVIVDDYLELDDCCMIAYNRDEAHIAKRLKETKKNLIFGHFGLGKYEYNGHIINSNIEYNKETIYVLGHIHKKQMLNNIIYPGAIAPTNLSELGQDFGILIIEDDSQFTWVSFEYGIKIKTIKDISELKGIDELTFLNIYLKELKEKAVYMANIKDYLAINFIVEDIIDKKKKIDFNLNFNLIVEEYLKMIGKLQLKRKIFEYLDNIK